MFKQKIIELISKETKLKSEQVETLIETPPNPEMGDYAFPCFILSKKYKKSPKEIAEKLISKIKPTKNIDEVKKQ